MSIRAFASLGTLFVVALAVACSSQAGTTPASDAGGGGDAGGTDGSVGDAEAGKPFAPTQLRSFESNAEGISDACKIVDYTKAGAILGEAKTNWLALKPLVVSAGAASSLVTRIDDTLAKITTDISGMLQRACENDANVVTLAVPDLFDLYSYPVPSDALRGDGVFRQLQIDGEYSDFTAAAPDLTATKAVWARLKPLTVAQAPMRGDIPGSATVVVDLDKAITDCETAITAHDPAALQTAAQAGLDGIDTVEAIFK